MRHGFNENRTRIPLKLLAIPAGFEPATHGVEIRGIMAQTPQDMFEGGAISFRRRPLCFILP
jgi:hypothetical protein